MKTKKIIACGLAIGALLMPIHTFAMNKSETVYSHLNYDGSSASSVVTNHLSFIKDGDLEDETKLKEILNIKGEETYRLDGSRLTWNARGQDIFYRGTIEKEMPIDVQINYYIDSNPDKLENIIGKKGHIKIEYIFKNKLKNKMYINGKNETIYTPFLTTVGTIIKGENSRNISVENGKVIDTGSRSIVVAVASPGLYESTKLEEFKSLNKVVIEFDTDSFSLGTAYLISTPKLLEEKDITLFKKADDLKANINKLQENMALLDKGAKELELGANDLEIGSNTLSKSLSQALKASTELKSGSIELNRGLTEMKRALENTKTDISNEGSADLLTLKTANSKTINSLISSTGKTLEELTSIYTGNNLSAYTGTDPTLLAIKSSYELIGLLNKNNQAIEKTLTTREEMLQKVNTMMTTLNETVTLLEAGSTSLANGTSQLEKGLEQIYRGAQKLNIGSEKLSSGSQNLSKGTATFKKEGIDRLSSYASSLKTYSDRAEALVSLSRKYNGYASTNSNETLFIYKIEAKAAK